MTVHIHQLTPSNGAFEPFDRPPTNNRLLSELPEDVQQRIFPHLELVEIGLGQVICESGTKLRHVYFPLDSIVSLLYVTANGASAEIAVVGCDGMVGVSQYLGGGSTTSRAVVQSEGFAYRLLGQRLMNEFNLFGALFNLLLRYSQALLTQTAQTAVCNRHHSIEQQLCRWLLLSIDRLPSPILVMTQELIANMLGVRREGVTQAAGNLQKLGIINYRRGHIEVIDRQLLEKTCCECYRVVQAESRRLMPVHRCCSPI